MGRLLLPRFDLFSFLTRLLCEGYNFSFFPLYTTRISGMGRCFMTYMNSKNSNGLQSIDGWVFIYVTNGCATLAHAIWLGFFLIPLFFNLVLSSPLVLSGIPQGHGHCLYCLLSSVSSFFFFPASGYFIFACFIFTGHTGDCPYTGCLFFFSYWGRRTTVAWCLVFFQFPPFFPSPL